MINNRNKSLVRSMAWNADGQRICIVYEDGKSVERLNKPENTWNDEVTLFNRVPRFQTPVRPKSS